MPQRLDELVTEFRIALDSGDISKAKTLLDAYSQSGDKSAKTLAQMNRDFTRLSSTIRTATRDFQKLIETGDKLRQLGFNIQGIGRDLEDFNRTFFGKTKEYADNYVRAFGKIEAASNRYQLGLSRIEAANTRIGRITTQALLPGMEKAADASERWARFAERHPEVIGGIANIQQYLASGSQAVVQAGTVVNAMGALLTLPTRLTDAFKAAKQIFNFGLQLAAAQQTDRAATKQLTAAAIHSTASTRQGIAAAVQSAAATAQEGAATASGLSSVVQNAAAAAQEGAGAIQTGAAAQQTVAAQTQAAAAARGGAGGLTASGVGISALLGVGLGVAGYNAYAAKTGRASAGQIAGQTAAVGASALGQLFGGKELADKWFISIADLTGALDASTIATLEAARTGKAPPSALESSPFQAQAIEAFTRFAQEAAIAEQDYQERRATQIKEGNDAILDKNKEFQEQLLTDLKTFQAKQRTDSVKFDVQQAADKRKLAADEREQDAALDHRRTNEDKERAFQRAKDLGKLQEEETTADSTYYQDRLKAVEEFGEQAAQRERDFQKEQRRASEDHQERMYDLAGQQDALGLLREKRNFEKERKRRQEDHDEQTAQANADLGKRLKEMEAAFGAERQKRLDDYEQRYQDEDEALKHQRRLEDQENAYQRKLREDQFRQQQETDRRNFNAEQELERNQFYASMNTKRKQHADEMTQLQQANKVKLDQFDAAYTKERTARQNALNKELADWGLFGQDELKLRDQYYKIMTSNLEKYLKNQAEALKGGTAAQPYNAPVYVQPGQSPPANLPPGTPVITLPGTPTIGGGAPASTGAPVGRRQGGGYSETAGLYAMAERGYEYTMSHSATRAAEGLIGGRLSQEAILGALVRGRTANINQSFAFQGMPQGADVSPLLAAIKQMTEQALAEAFSD